MPLNMKTAKQQNKVCGKTYATKVSRASQVFPQANQVYNENSTSQSSINHVTFCTELASKSEETRFFFSSLYRTIYTQDRLIQVQHVVNVQDSRYQYIIHHHLKNNRLFSHSSVMVLMRELNETFPCLSVVQNWVRL